MCTQTDKTDAKQMQEENPSVWDRTAEQPAGYTKRAALAVLDELYHDGLVGNADYDAIYDALCEIETLKDRDELLEELWSQFGDIPMNPETECIEAPFLGWGPGVNRMEIWHWFDRRHSKGVAHLLYSGEICGTDRPAKLVYICAPLRGNVEKNIEFARRKAREVFQSGEMPVCPHLMFPPIADPGDPSEDQAARDMGLRLVSLCQQLNVYGDECTAGMQEEINFAASLGIPVKHIQEAGNHAEEVDDGK